MAICFLCFEISFECHWQRVYVHARFVCLICEHANKVFKTLNASEYSLYRVSFYLAFTSNNKLRYMMAL